MAKGYKSGYRNLLVWKEAKNLTVLVYQLTEDFPKNEEFGLKSQMRRSSVSIMSQIAEGWLRSSKKVKINYLEIAEGSLLELESHTIISHEVKYIQKEELKEFMDQRNKVGYLLHRYMKKIKENEE